MSPSLRSTRLILDTLVPADAEALFEHRSHPDVTRFQSWCPESVEDARTFIARNADRGYGELDTWHQLAIRWADDRALIGDIGVHVASGPGPQIEFGITVAPKHQRQGIGREALALLFAHLFEDLGAHRIVASVDPENEACLALLARAGMRQEAHHRQSLFWRGRWVDDIIFALLRSEA